MEGSAAPALRCCGSSRSFAFIWPKEKSNSEVEKPRDRRAGPALPFSSRRLAVSGESSTVLRMRLVGANANAAVTGAGELPGKTNYFLGNDPKKWRTNVPTYAQVKYQGVYPGVDLVYYGNQGGQLEYDFVVAPGADPSAIVLDVGRFVNRPLLRGSLTAGRRWEHRRYKIGRIAMRPYKSRPTATSWLMPRVASFVSSSRWSTNPQLIMGNGKRTTDNGHPLTEALSCKLTIRLDSRLLFTTAPSPSSSIRYLATPPTSVAARLTYPEPSRSTNPAART